jgi:hypothetical protein
MADTAEVPEPPLCFVIGPISNDGSPARKHSDLLLHSVIKHVLEADGFGYKVKRADEDADPGMIGDRVISDIIHAELVVADLTDLNPNAFYELGIRHSTEKPTIHIAKAGTVLPFDNAAHRTIFVDLTDWESTQAGRSRLAAFASAIKEPGHKVSNPITQANASFKMRQSADPQERVIAQLQERVSLLELRSGHHGETLPQTVRRLISEAVSNGVLPGRVVEEMNRWLTERGTGCNLSLAPQDPQPGVAEYRLFKTVPGSPPSLLMRYQHPHEIQ